LKAVSVVIPAHNAAATIAATLASLRSEADLIGEVLLVDDSSSDGTAAVARDAASHAADAIESLLDRGWVPTLTEYNR